MPATAVWRDDLAAQDGWLGFKVRPGDVYIYYQMN